MGLVMVNIALRVEHFITGFIEPALPPHLPSYVTVRLLISHTKELLLNCWSMLLPRPFLLCLFG